MRVAAYQAPLRATKSSEVIGIIRRQVSWCEENDVEILCCPEGIVGGLADYARRPLDIAINVENGELSQRLSPLASDRVATIVGFTEAGSDGKLYNSAAVLHRGTVVGIYRKRNPAIRKSVYERGAAIPVFRVGGLCFGIMVCRDSLFPELAQNMVAQGVRALFVPTNNALPPQRGGSELIAECRRVDGALARACGVALIRADVAGRCGGLTSYGSSSISVPGGSTIRRARALRSGLIIADIPVDGPTNHA